MRNVSGSIKSTEVNGSVGGHRNSAGIGVPGAVVQAVLLRGGVVAESCRDGNVFVGGSSDVRRGRGLGRSDFIDVGNGVSRDFRNISPDICRPERNGSVGGKDDAGSVGLPTAVVQLVLVQLGVTVEAGGNSDILVGGRGGRSSGDRAVGLAVINVVNVVSCDGTVSGGIDTTEINVTVTFHNNTAGVSLPVAVVGGKFLTDTVIAEGCRNSNAAFGGFSNVGRSDRAIRGDFVDIGNDIFGNLRKGSVFEGTAERNRNVLSTNYPTGILQPPAIVDTVLVEYRIFRKGCRNSHVFVGQSGNVGTGNGRRNDHNNGIIDT